MQDASLQLTHAGEGLLLRERLGLLLVGLGLLVFVVAAFGAGALYPTALLAGGIGLLVTGALLYFGRALRRPAGIDHDDRWRTPVLARGAVGWLLAVVLTGFYVLLYWFPALLAGLVALFDPLADWIGYPEGVESRRWIMYGAFYTLAVLVMGVRAILKYRHSRYHILRTLSVVFFQLVFAFLFPYLLVLFRQPEFYFHYFWPLKYDYLWPGTVGWLTDAGAVGAFMVFWGAVMIFIATPLLTYFFGKRWYCSWVCGCGGLAETAGDPFRQLSDTSLRAWQVERWMIHGVLVLIVGGTVLLWVDAATGVLGGAAQTFSAWYGFLIGLVFAGVVGVGFYPLMGARVWCRYGCPMAAVLGLQQRFFSRFRITTNGGQCISCGNCSTYCEMGIDVRWYAQRGQDVVRASCVGCGVCASVCPRGVLKLENGPPGTRGGSTAFVERDAVAILGD